MDKEINHNNGSQNGHIKIPIREILLEIKGDITKLPCRTGDEKLCLQDKNLITIKKDIEVLEKNHLHSYNKTIAPLLESNVILLQKQNTQQESLTRIESTLDKMQITVQSNQIDNKKEIANLRLKLTTQITELTTQKVTVTEEKRKKREIIAWTIATITSSIILYNLIIVLINGIITLI